MKTSVVSKNIFPTFFPISAALYMEEHNIPIRYVRICNGKLALSEITFSDILEVGSDKLNTIKWNREQVPKKFSKSLNGPPMDVVPVISEEELLEMETKLTVVPTHTEKLITELIIRQNTQFSLAERLAHRYPEFFNTVPVDEDMLNKAIENCDGVQHVFILHGVWKTEGKTYVLDKKNTCDVFAISDFAYLSMLLQLQKYKKNVPTRGTRVINRIRSWVNDYVDKGRMTYKTSREQSVDHLKVTLHPVKFLPELKNAYNNARLDIAAFKQIVPDSAVNKMSPERRLDLSAMLEVELRSKDHNIHDSISSQTLHKNNVVS